MIIDKESGDKGAKVRATIYLSVDPGYKGTAR